MNKVVISVFLVFCVSFVFRGKTSDKVTNLKESKTNPSFLQALEAGERLDSFFAINWVLVYRVENRCNGTTQGISDSLSSAKIDQIIHLKANNDGQGWACDPKEPKTFSFEFDLRKQIQSWDRFEEEIVSPGSNSAIYLFGKGESDYIILHLTSTGKVNKLEYISEDPG